jgi:twitching motility protein PilU
MVGATGSGKSTTLAAMVGHRNQNAQDHIITVEDPIEYVHTHGKSIITQREIGMDTEDWESALKNTLRQAPRERRDQLLLDLSLNLRAIVSQRLITRTDGKGRIPAVEILLNSPLITDLIMKGRLDEIKEIMGRSRDLGMQTFDQSLFDLFSIGIISGEDALRNADSFNDLRLKIKLHIKDGSGTSPLSGLDHLDIV